MRCVFKLKELLVVCLACLWSGPALAQAIVVLPYVQPGDARGASSDAKVLHWFTDQQPGNFVSGVSAPRQPLADREIDAHRGSTSRPSKSRRPKRKSPRRATTGLAEGGQDRRREKRAQGAASHPEKEHHYFKYTAQLNELPLATEVRYRVREGEQLIHAGRVLNVLATRWLPVGSLPCAVLVGDLAQGRPHQRAIAYQIHLQKPEFLVALGDIVYPTGRINQYMHFYWGTYNDAPAADPKIGAPLMARVPFYPVLGNHDIGAKLSKVPDALGAYYFFSPPKNGPGEGPWTTPLDGDEAVNAKFRAANKDSYPFIDCYSFDNGPAHFVVLNVNPKMDLSAPAFRKWLVADLRGAKDRWKIVCFHMPGFHSSKKHYAEQQARPLSPIFEEEGVTLTFAGHVHNYQRTVPLRFRPADKQAAKLRVDGEFTLDKVFDGVKNTPPNGVIHVVAGGGGASLYGPGLDQTKDALTKQFGANYADFTTKMVVDQHSFTVLDCAPNSLVLRAISVTGEELDRAVISKK